MDNNQIDAIRFWAGLIIIVTLVSILGLGGLVKSLAILLLFVFLAPVIIAVGFQLWLKTRLVTAPCPVCGEVSTAIKEQNFNCPNCGEPLATSGNKFIRPTPPGTIDVEVQTID